MRLFVQLLALCGLVSAAHAQSIEENEALVMQIIFEDCLGFVRDDRVPFEALNLSQAGNEVLPYFPKGARADISSGAIKVSYLFGKTYVVSWGEDMSSRHCVVQDVNRKAAGERWLGVDPVGFLDRVTKRADAAGLTKNTLPDEFTALATTSWREPVANPFDGLRISLLPSQWEPVNGLMDVGLIIVAGPKLLGLS
jgi:hypothetical protein